MKIAKYGIFAKTDTKVNFVEIKDIKIKMEENKQLLLADLCGRLSYYYGIDWLNKNK